MAKIINVPSNIEAEKAVLGAMMQDQNALFNCIGVLDEDCFCGEDSPNRLVFKAIRDLNTASKPIDVQTITNQLINDKVLDQVGGPNYLLELIDSTFSISNVNFYLNSVKDYALLRKYLATINDIQKEYASKPIKSITDFIGDSDARLRSIAEKRSVGEFRTAEDIVSGIKEALQDQRSNNGLIGITTGFPKIDEYTLGLQRKDMIVVAARPSVGKTQLSLNIAFNACKNANRPVAIFSLEMPAEQLVKRLLATRSDINLNKIMLGNIDDSNRHKLNQGIRDLEDVQLYIDDSPNNNLNNIIAKSRKLKAKHDDLGLVVIDYIGLISLSENHKTESRQQDVSMISRSLKSLAREIDCPIIVVSQLSRDSEKRDDNRPMMSDLRESGAIEQDADVIILLHREDIFKAYKKIGGKKFSQLGNDEKAIAAKKQQIDELLAGLGPNVENLTVIIAKNRNGQIGDTHLHFFKNTGKFATPTQHFLDEFKRIMDSTPQED